MLALKVVLTLLCAFSAQLTVGTRLSFDSRAAGKAQPLIL